ncbi:MAG: 4Fe-4S binding protein [Bilophila sp.]
MIRTIVKIDKERCTGCGLCVTACHEGAIALVEGKAVLLRDDYCDGLGDCLPVCPAGAISFEQRDTVAYDEDAVKKRQQASQQAPLECGCPGSHSRLLEPIPAKQSKKQVTEARDVSTCLRQWPVQLRLAPVEAAYFNGADLLLSADCAAYACGDFHKRFMCGRITLIACPKLDTDDQAGKLKAILQMNTIKSLTVTRMEVPCCSGLEQAARAALLASGKDIPLKVVVITPDGRIQTDAARSLS